MDGLRLILNLARRVSIGVALALAVNTAFAANITWTGGFFSDWNNPTNWTPQQVPTVNDHVIINSGDVAVPTGAEFSIMNWTGGSIYGVLTVASNATLVLSGTAEKSLYAVLTNYGTLNWTNGGTFTLYNHPNNPDYNGAVWNQPGGLIDVQSDAAWLQYESPFAFVVNAGTLRKSAGAGTTYVYLSYTNSGTVQALSGTLSFQGGGSLDGSFTAVAGAAVDFAGGTFLLPGPPGFSGPGRVGFSGGAEIQFTVPISQFTLDSGRLAGTNRVTGMLRWTGGSISGALTVASNATLVLSGTAEKSLYAVLTNYGTLNWTNGGPFTLYNHPNNPDYKGAVWNQPGGLIDVQGDAAWSQYESPFAFVVNAGTLRKSAAAGTTYVNLSCTNSGTVQALSGTLSFQGGGSLDGSFTAVAGARIALASGAFLQHGTPQFTGAGQSEFSGSELTLTTDVTRGLTLTGGTLITAPSFQGGSITNLTLSGPALKGANRVTGSLYWTGGSISGALTVASNATLVLSGTAEKSLYAVLTNYGTLNWTNGGPFRLYNHPNNPDYKGAVWNQPGGLIDVQSDAAWSQYESPFAFVVNAGTLRKSAAAGTTYVNLSCTNSGTVQALSGTLSFQGDYTSSSTASIAFAPGASTPGAGYGRIQFGSPIVMAGTFSISTGDAFQPNPGDTFNVLSFPSATNDFACYRGLDLGGGLWLQPQLHEKGLTLMATRYATNGQPTVFIANSPGGLRVLWNAGFPEWTLVSSPNLESPVWIAVPVSIICDHQAILPATGAMQYFRLRRGE